MKTVHWCLQCVCLAKYSGFRPSTHDDSKLRPGVPNMKYVKVEKGKERYKQFVNLTSPLLEITYGVT